jgi:hypothetical protein
MGEEIGEHRKGIFFIKEELPVLGIKTEQIRGQEQHGKQYSKQRVMG